MFQRAGKREQEQQRRAFGPGADARGADGDGDLSDTLTIWAQGHRTYHDYVLRGVARAAKLTPA